MMTDLKINDMLRKSLEGSKLDQIAFGNETILDWALNLEADHVITLPASEISKAIYALSKYVGFLQGQMNAREFALSEEKSYFNRKISLAITNYPKGTVQERESKALESSEELRMLEDRVSQAKSDYLMCQKMPDMIIERINALKKELSRRGVKPNE